jgi:hypothetical protein
MSRAHLVIKDSRELLGLLWLLEFLWLPEIPKLLDLSLLCLSVVILT